MKENVYILNLHLIILFSDYFGFVEPGRLCFTKKIKRKIEYHALVGDPVASFPLIFHPITGFKAQSLFFPLPPFILAPLLICWRGSW